MELLSILVSGLCAFLGAFIAVRISQKPVPFFKITNSTNETKSPIDESVIILTPEWESKTEAQASDAAGARL